ncbi:hypothetical protein GLOIN_2v1045623 [Rhizophagus irregularis DAOM 181602=DAOM 197198]|uniref:Uncharacterized protein n=1 Tax=Rhizophagus irregularis (strain DAOM 181602 / DAOM 197198 / MUCL 43194) TaxID=747089 RepID=A0A2P4QA71_RHIID|nr:hypothetical protein GLOIN_2v1045623 [Rhizophagus irregularis DAOM 181602=DAOM 197198]POG74498.1 hypothetical protein GLOIN_2v1045623 [Rhizophagus irregularis DAOM 181602=DAOM 197198]GET61270.1 hypothetical protein GLOIN_2v1045623 [Rhizophagus irregularis DAOM 181602=DAOM 197198]|eukprot:XP_025181364.1 hypothetical protein GLOIN_2v1045623 [Rhizophagus irregularis DAOM 181602=DAOM 197198]
MTFYQTSIRLLIRHQIIFICIGFVNFMKLPFKVIDGLPLINVNKYLREFVNQNACLYVLYVYCNYLFYI